VFARTREEILLAAAHLLAANGKGTVSLADIAAEVGMTAPALYAYFANKQAILDALIDLLERELAATVAVPAARGVRFPEKLLDLIRRRLALFDARREIVLAVFALHRSGDAGPSKRMPPPVAQLLGLRAWLRREARTGDLGVHSRDDAAVVLNGLLQGFFFRWMLTGAREPLALEADQIAHYFFHGVGGPGRVRRLVRTLGSRTRTTRGKA
jgi:AcrR family transcriptional regulator